MTKYRIDWPSTLNCVRATASDATSNDTRPGWSTNTP